MPAELPMVSTESEVLVPAASAVEIVADDEVSFSDTVDYQAVSVRDGLVVLSWQEHIGSTIVHTLDFVSGEAYTAVTPAKGEFMRLRGRIHIK
jgi:hypothetical protein